MLTSMKYPPRASRQILILCIASAFLYHAQGSEGEINVEDTWLSSVCNGTYLVLPLILGDPRSLGQYANCVDTFDDWPCEGKTYEYLLGPAVLEDSNLLLREELELGRSWGLEETLLKVNHTTVSVAHDSFTGFTVRSAKRRRTKKL